MCVFSLFAEAVGLMIASVVEVKSAIIAVPVLWNGDDVSCYGNSSNDGKYQKMLAFGMPNRTLLLCIVSIKGDERLNSHT